jgi:hypothetical protein
MGPFFQPVSTHDKMVMPRQLCRGPRVEDGEDQSEPRGKEQCYPRRPAGDPNMMSDHRVTPF